MSDLESERTVSKEEAQQKAQELNALYFETSAATGSNIDEVRYQSNKTSRFLSTPWRKQQNNLIQLEQIQNKMLEILFSYLKNTHRNLR